MSRGLGCRPDAKGVIGTHLSLREMLGFCNTLHVPATLDASAAFDGRFLNQGGSSSCVGHGWARAIQRAMRMGVDPDGELPSPLHIYDVARALTGERGIDNGTTIGAAAEQTAALGFCRESACPWDPGRVLDRLDLDEYQAGIDQRDLVTHRLLSTGDDLVSEVKASLAAGKGVAVGMDVDTSFVTWPGGVWPGMVGDRLGGHCMAIWDYPLGDPRLVGSYGTGWADGGWFMTTWKVVASCRSIWVVDVVPSYSR